MQDAAAGGHPLGVALADDAATAVGVVVRDLAVEHVGDGLEPAVRVPRRALGLVRLVLAPGRAGRAGGTGRCRAAQAARERAPHLEAGALDGVVRGHRARARAAPPSSPGRDGRCGGARAGCRRSQRAWRPPRGQWGVPLQPSCVRNYSAPVRSGSARAQADRERSRPRRTRRPFQAGAVGRPARARGTAGSGCRARGGPRAGPAPRRGSGGCPSRTPGAAPHRRG